MNLQIYQPTTRTTIPLTSSQLKTPLKNISTLLTPILGYTTLTHPYAPPVHSFSNLPFIKSSLTIEEIINYYPSFCLTFQNTQYIEEPDFLVEEKDLGDGNVVVIVQVCQGGYFFHERYRLKVTDKMYFIKSLCQRFGSQIHVTYHQIRLPLNKFSDNQAVSDNLIKYRHPNKSIILTVTNFVDNCLFRNIPSFDLVDQKRYYKIQIQGYEDKFVLCREVDWKVIEAGLEVIFGGKVLGLTEEGFINLGQRKMKEDGGIVRLKMSEKVMYKLPQSLTNSLFLGTHKNHLFILQNSSLLHIHSINPPFKKQNTLYLLQSKPSTTNEEYNAFFNKNHLILYNITPQSINLKYFDPFSGNLNYMKCVQWDSKQFKSIGGGVNLMGMGFGKGRVRVFYVDQYGKGMEVYVLGEWKLWGCQRGADKIWSRCGYFCVYDDRAHEVVVYNLHNKQQIASITLPNKQKIEDISIQHSHHHNNNQLNLLLKTPKTLLIYNLKLIPTQTTLLQQLQIPNTSYQYYYLNTINQKYNDFYINSKNYIQKYGSKEKVRVEKGAICVLKREEGESQCFGFAKDDFYLDRDICGFALIGG